MIDPKYPLFDCAWIASDALGNVGVFVTAGMGPIPSAAIGNPDLDILDVEKTVCDQEVVSKVIMLADYPISYTFTDLAERGFYVFEWKEVQSENELIHLYECIAFPASPSAGARFTGGLKSMLADIVLRGVDFSTRDGINESVVASIGRVVSMPDSY